MKRKLTNEFLIDDAPMLTPDGGVAIDYEDLISADSGRDESGYEHIIVLRSELKTWGFTYAWLTAEEYTYMRSLLRGKSNFLFTFTDENGEKQTVKASCKQKSVAYWSARRGTYKDLQFEIKEC